MATFLIRVRRQESYKQAKTWRAKLGAVREHWGQSLRDGAIVTVCVWVCLFTVSLTRIVYLDHQHISDQASLFKQERDTVRSERDSLKTERDSLKTENDTLKTNEKLLRRSTKVTQEGPSQAQSDTRDISAALQKFYDDGQIVKNALYSSDDGMSTTSANQLFQQWRSTLREYISQHISTGKAQHVDGIPSVMSMSYNGMKRLTTRTEKENLITHINVRLERLSEVMKNY